MHLVLVDRDIKFEKAFGEKVREIRSSYGWSQKQLADHANLEQNQIQRVENSKNTTSLAIITAIAKALGKQPYEILKTEYQVKVNTNFDRQVRSKSAKTTSNIHHLLKTSYLNSPKSVIEIVRYCKEKFNATIPSSATSAVLKKLVDNRQLKRVPAKIKGRYLYQKVTR